MEQIDKVRFILKQKDNEDWIVCPLCNKNLYYVKDRHNVNARCETDNCFELNVTFFESFEEYIEGETYAKK